jgi:hypothetical protein
MCVRMRCVCVHQMCEHQQVTTCVEWSVCSTAPPQLRDSLLSHVANYMSTRSHTRCSTISLPRSSSTGYIFAIRAPFWTLDEGRKSSRRKLCSRAPLGEFRLTLVPPFLVAQHNCSGS